MMIDEDLKSYEQGNTWSPEVPLLEPVGGLGITSVVGQSSNVILSDDNALNWNELLNECQAALIDCSNEKIELEEENVTLQAEKTALCLELSKISPNGTFSYSLVNATRPFGSVWRDYYQSYGTLIMLPDNGGSIRFDSVNKHKFLYAENIDTRQIIYTSHHILGSDSWKVLNSSKFVVPYISTSAAAYYPRTFYITVDFDGNLGNAYPASDYYNVGTIVVTNVEGGDAIVGFEDIGGCDEE
jgi:hypothetical protein